MLAQDAHASDNSRVFVNLYAEKPALEGIAGHSAQVTHLAQRGKPVAKNFGPASSLSVD